MRRVDRRAFLGAATTAGALGMAGCGALSGGSPSTWELTYGDENDRTIFHDVLPRSDGGYLAAGVDETAADGEQGLLVASDAAGEEVWSSTYGTSNRDSFGGVVDVADGYVAGGFRDVRDGSRGLLVGVDGDGSRSWERTYDAGRYTVGTGPVSDGDGGVLLVGRAGPEEFTGTPWILRIDAEGTETWRETYPSAGPGGGVFFDATALDDGYLLAGRGRESEDGRAAGLVVRIDDAGEVDWVETYETGNFRRVTPVDGGFVLAGRQRPDGDVVAWLLAIDDAGEVRWNETYELDHNSELTDVVPQGGGGILGSLGGGGPDGYLATGWSTPEAPGDGDEAWLLEVDAEGERRGARTLDGGLEVALALTPTDDGAFAVAGYEIMGNGTDISLARATLAKTTGADQSGT